MKQYDCQECFFILGLRTSLKKAMELLFWSGPISFGTVTMQSAEFEPMISAFLIEIFLLLRESCV